MSTKKMTKHQMKEDRLVTSVFRFWEWARLHTRQLSIGLGSVGVALLAIYLFTTTRSGNTRKAAELFGQAVIEMQTPAPGQMQAALNDFQVLLRDYPRSRWAPYACFYLANLLFQDGQYPRAKELFKQYIDQYAKDSLMAASAYAGMAACLEQEKDYLTAAEYYLKGADLYPGSILVPEYLYAAGRNYLKGDQKQKAVEAYQRLLREHPNSSYANSAREELSSIVVS